MRQGRWKDAEPWILVQQKIAARLIEALVGRTWRSAGFRLVVHVIRELPAEENYCR